MPRNPDHKVIFCLFMVIFCLFVVSSSTVPQKFEVTLGRRRLRSLHASWLLISILEPDACNIWCIFVKSISMKHFIKGDVWCVLCITLCKFPSNLTLASVLNRSRVRIRIYECSKRRRNPGGQHFTHFTWENMNSALIFIFMSNQCHLSGFTCSLTFSSVREQPETAKTIRRLSACFSRAMSPSQVCSINIWIALQPLFITVSISVNS